MHDLHWGGVWVTRSSCAQDRTMWRGTRPSPLAHASNKGCSQHQHRFPALTHACVSNHRSDLNTQTNPNPIVPCHTPRIQLGLPWDPKRRVACADERARSAGPSRATAATPDAGAKGVKKLGSIKRPDLTTFHHSDRPRPMPVRIQYQSVDRSVSDQKLPTGGVWGRGEAPPKRQIHLFTLSSCSLVAGLVCVVGLFGPSP